MSEQDKRAYADVRLSEENDALIDENMRLRAALDRLLRETMCKDHPEASQQAIDALAGTKSQGPVL